MFAANVDFENLCLFFFTPLLLSLLLVPVASGLAHKLGAIDRPNGRSSHTTPTPRLGGLAISASLVITCIAYLPFDRFLLAFVLGLLIAAATGLVDDMVGIRPRWKFLGQIASASAFVYFSGMPLHGIGNILGFGDIPLGWVASAFTVFFIVGGMNAFNLADGLDGLAGGISAIAAALFAYFAWLTQNWVLLLLAISLCGSVIGFLRYNTYPARVFMGDCGSLMLGYTLTVVVVVLAQGSGQDRHDVPLVALATVIALPLLDTLLVMARRIYYGNSPFLADRTHLHHRLMELGLPHPSAVTTIHMVMLCFGLLAILIHDDPEWLQFAYLLFSGAAFFGSISLLQHSRFRFGMAKEQSILSIRQAAADSSNT